MSSPYLLRIEDRELLQNLIGRCWDHWGVGSTNPRRNYALVRFFIRTEDSFIAIESDTCDALDHPSDPDITRLSVDSDNWDERNAIKSGGLFFHDRGKIIRQIYVIRDIEIVSDSTNQPSTSEFDSGIIFQFDHGVIAFHKVNFYDLDFSVDRWKSFGEISLSPNFGRFQQSLEYQVQLTRLIIPLEDCG